jgi:GT2 family glycosyltransferase
MDKIAAIVVTYNRQDCLIDCLEAIQRQTLPPDIIYIVDNHSTCDTAEKLLLNKIIPVVPEMDVSEDVVITSQIYSLNQSSNIILIKYIYKFENTGGAGGFYTGMKTAYDDGYEWFWMMDDDGLPAEDCAEQLLVGAKKHNLDYANALVVNIDDRVSLSFGLEKGKTNINDYKNIDVVYNEVNPFNSTFINRKVPEKIGFIKKEMFIWGDETEYQHRTIKNKFNVATVAKSIHYHPEGKGNAVNIFPFINKYKVFVKPEKFAGIYYRNLGYIYYTHCNIVTCLVLFIRYILYFLLRLKFLECKNFMIAYTNGCKNKFS